MVTSLPVLVGSTSFLRPFGGWRSSAAPADSPSAWALAAPHIRLKKPLETPLRAKVGMVVLDDKFRSFEEMDLFEDTRRECRDESDAEADGDCRAVTVQTEDVSDGIRERSCR